MLFKKKNPQEHSKQSLQGDLYKAVRLQVSNL